MQICLAWAILSSVEPEPDEVFDLFVALGANDEQLDFPILYASGRDGWCTKELTEKRESLHSLLDLVLDWN